MAKDLATMGAFMITRCGDVENCLSVIREAADWLASVGMPLWKPEDLTADRMLHDRDRSEFVTGYLDALPVAAMVLQWDDPLLWPDIVKGESGFIHKLSVKRNFAGKGFSMEMVRYAESECRLRKANYLRLDCDAGRDKLRALYESMGFRQVGRRMAGPFDVVFFEKLLA